MVRSLMRVAAVAGVAALAAACQQQGASTTAAPPANGEALRAALSGTSLLLLEEAAVISCTYLDPALHGYSFDDPADIDRFLAWRVESDSRLCLYNGAVLDCYTVARFGDDSLQMAYEGSDTVLDYEVAAGDRCG